jgi:DNA-directed RNA polymerase specialized sigma24 family protein
MKTEWMLTSEALDRLLLWLSPDRDQAGARYVEIRRRLIKFFVCRRCSIPEELADRTFDRVMQAIETQTIRCPEQPLRYFFGVAKKIHLEFGREKTTLPKEALPLPGNRTEPEFRCLEKCLGQLTEQERSLISRYYEHDGHEKIVNRQSQAEEFGLDMNALRIRVFRIKKILRECHSKCMAKNDLIKIQSQ